jgi:monofunctional glycosyltransferase
LSVVEGQPAEQSAQRDKQLAGIGKLRSRGWRAILGKIIRFGVILALVPVALMVVYIIPIIHPVSTLMLKDVVTLKGYDRQWVDIDDIAPVLIHSVMMSEDGQFCTHSGVDWTAVNQVVDDAMEGEPSRGASTIAMQSVKNLYLWSSRSVIRKIIELPYALVADLIWSKRRMMEIYLNIAEWGPGVYGIEAAAQHHFNTSAKNLSSRQASLLAVTLPNPILRKPAKPSKGLNRLAKLNERRAAQAGGYVECVN